MRLGPIRSEQRGQPQHLGCVSRLPAVEIEQAEVQEQLPIVEAKRDRLLVLGEFLTMLADHAVRESQVIVSERVAGIVLYYDAMAFDGLGVVFHAVEIVCEWIANLLVGSTAPGAGAGADRRLENQRDQWNQANARTPKAQQLLKFPA